MYSNDNLNCEAFERCAILFSDFILNLSTTNEQSVQKEVQIHLLVFSEGYT